MVSVVLPLLRPNHEFLRLAVRSILDQDFAALELIVVEDPSDSTGTSVMQSFDDPRIVYQLNGARTSLTHQLNQGIGLSTHELIARMDADDVSAPSRISKQVNFLARHAEVSVVGTNLEIIDELGRSLGYRRYPHEHPEIARQLRLYCALAHPSVVFRKSDVREIGGYQAAAPIEDWDLWCRLLKAGKGLHNLQEPLLRYRVHPQTTKATSLRRTLTTGVELKERYFKSDPATWGLRERTRCTLERVLLRLPPRLVMKLFLMHALERKPQR